MSFRWPLVVMVPAVANAAAAPAPQIGRLPVLAPLRTSAGSCRTLLMNDTLRRRGMVRGVSFASPSPERLISVSTDANGRPVLLMALASIPGGPQRRIGESLSVHFTSSGGIRSGTRSFYTMGIPAKSSEDRHAGLLPADTVAARRLVAEVLDRCAALLNGRG